MRVCDYLAMPPAATRARAHSLARMRSFMLFLTRLPQRSVVMVKAKRFCRTSAIGGIFRVLLVELLYPASVSRVLQYAFITRCATTSREH